MEHSEHKSVELEQIRMDFERFGVIDPVAEDRMCESIKIYGQLSPLLAGQIENKLVLVDGFKRLRSMRTLKKERVRVCCVEEQSFFTLKAMVLVVNHEESAYRELEEALVLQSLYRDDGLEQKEIAQLCNRHKSWVCRRIALIERLSDEVLEQLRLGLLPISIARELAQLPRGNQNPVLNTVQKHRLNCQRSRRFIARFLSSQAHTRQLLLDNPMTEDDVLYRRRIDCGIFTACAMALERQIATLDTLIVHHGLGVLRSEQCTELHNAIERVGTRCVDLRAIIATQLQGPPSCP